MKKLLAILLVLAMVFSFAACGKEEQQGQQQEQQTTPEKVTFIMGIDAEYPPFSYLGDDGKYAGFDVDVCKAACDLLGWEFEVFGVNWDQKLVQLDAKECDCVWSGMTILDSMKQAGYVISDPYFDNTQVILVKDSSDIKSSADLAGKVVAVQLGTSGEALLNGDLADMTKTFKSLTTCDSFLKCFTELGGNAVDAVFVDAPVAKAYAEKNAGYRIIDEALGAEQYGIAFRSGDQAICDQIEAAVQKLVDNGTYKTIADKYPDVSQNSLLFLQ